MVENTKTVSSIIDDEYKEYAMYVIESRALPSYIDGFKPTTKKLLYAMLNHFKGKKHKVVEIGGSLSSVANYHHGETSAMGAVITMTSEWNNNVPIFKGYGNFGSRLIQEASAPRYIFAELNNEFYKYFSDFDVMTKNKDGDNPEPQQYLPNIPFVLVNGIEGIAVGFACKFLPHNVKDIAKACLNVVNGDTVKQELIPTFPHFKGEVIKVDDKQYITKGIVEKTKSNQFTISEVPIGYDRQKYFEVLDDLLTKNKISDFQDYCNENGFQFIVKVNKEQMEKITEPYSFFKLEKSITENYTAIDENGNLIIFKDKDEIIRRFVEFRIGKIQEQLNFDIDKINREIAFLESKQKFIEVIVGGKINIKNMTRDNLVEYCKDNVMMGGCENINGIITMPIYDMTIDKIDRLNNDIKERKSEVEKLKNTNPNDIFIERLKNIIDD